jgi:hypothetical protein
MTTTGTATMTRRNNGSMTGDLIVVLGAAAAAAGVWTVWTQLVGVELAADTGSGGREILLTDVAVTAAVIAVLGLLLCRLLVTRAAQGLRWWTGVAVGVCLVSLLGTAGAVSAGAGAGLVSLHLVVGAVVVLGARLVRRTR